MTDNRKLRFHLCPLTSIRLRLRCSVFGVRRWMFASDLDPGFWILNPAVSPQFLEALEKKYDEQFAVVFEAIKQLIAPPKKQIGSVPKKAPLGLLLWNSVVLSPLTADV